MIIQGKFKILFNKKIGADYVRMAICAPQIVRQAKPGQFVHLRCRDSIEPLLRRPFSFHRLNHDNFEILYKIVGRGTKLLAKKQKGDRIDILGPLGNGFDIMRNIGCLPDQQAGAISNTIIVAGGMGVAPLLALAQELAQGKRENNLLALLGARNKKQILCAKNFQKLGAKVKIATDDGSQGFKGLVTDLLKKLLRTTRSKQLVPVRVGTTIYACGPKAMLKEVAGITRRLRISAYASLEENMACGLGACLGCAIKTKRGYRQACKDGPVFNLKDIKWGKTK